MKHRKRLNLAMGHSGNRAIGIKKNSYSTHYEETLICLYRLISCADGQISDLEDKMGNLMKRLENINQEYFDKITSQLKSISQQELYKKSISLLKTCAREEQIRCIAWMRKIANSDGYMDDKEWSLIYRIYKKELGFSLKDITQHKLPKEN